MARTRRVALLLAGTAALLAAAGLVPNSQTLTAAATRHPAGTATTGVTSTTLPPPAPSPTISSSSWDTSASGRSPSPSATPSSPAPTGLAPARLLLLPAPSAAGTSSSSSPTPASSTTREPSCPQPPAVPLAQAPGRGRTVALTFDDGPSKYTPALLAVLRAAKVHATFFMIGSQAQRLPEVVAQVAAEGHLIGDHTWHHLEPQSVPGGWTRAYLRSELERTREVITRATGQPVCWFRPPGGSMPPSVLPTTRALGFGVALWSVDPKDWQLQGATTPPASLAGQLSGEILARVSAGLAQQHR